MKKAARNKWNVDHRFYQELGSFLKGRRLKVGLSQRAVAEALGYSSAQFISNFECGIVIPPLNKLKILVELYRMPIRELMEQIMRAEHSKISSSLRVAGTSGPKRS